MVKAAYCSGKPAYGVGAGNATMVIDETAEHRGGGPQHADQQDERPRLRLFGRWQPARGRVDLRRVPAAAADRRRVSRQRAREGSCSKRPTGTPRGIARPTRSRAPASVVAATGGLLDSRRQDVSDRRGKSHRQGNTASRRRSSAPCSRSSSITGSTRRSTWCGRSSRPAARVTPAGSIRSTTITSTGSRSSRR